MSKINFTDKDLTITFNYFHFLNDDDKDILERSKNKKIVKFFSDREPSRWYGEDIYQMVYRYAVLENKEVVMVAIQEYWYTVSSDRKKRREFQENNTFESEWWKEFKRFAKNKPLIEILRENEDED